MRVAPDPAQTGVIKETGIWEQEEVWTDLYTSQLCSTSTWLFGGDAGTGCTLLPAVNTPWSVLVAAP